MTKLTNTKLAKSPKSGTTSKTKTLENPKTKQLELILLEKNEIISKMQEEFTFLSDNNQSLREENGKLNAEVTSLRRIHEKAIGERDEVRAKFIKVTRENDYLRGKITVWQEAFKIINKMPVKPERSIEEDQEEILSTIAPVSIPNPKMEPLKKELDEDLILESDDNDLDSIQKTFPQLFNTLTSHPH